MFPLIWVIVITVGAGLLGGWAGYLIDAVSSDGSDATVKKQAQKRYLVLGLVAAGAVPLFLSLLQSALLAKIFTPLPNAGDAEVASYADFLVFAGFCLVAAVSARSFIDTLSRQVVRDLNAVKEQTGEALAQANEATQQALKATRTASHAEERATLVSDLVDESTGGQAVDAASMAAHSADGGVTGPVPHLSSLERTVLGTMMNVSFRTATGVGRDAGLPRPEAAEALNSLADKRLVERTTSPITGGPRWRVTRLGVHALKAPE